MPGGVPYWRLSAFYLFFFAALGALLPYWGPYLRELGFSAREIGELIAILHATKIIAPNVWGYIADHLDRRMAIVRLACVAALVAYAGVLLGDEYWWLALVMAAFSFFWNAALPQFEANTMNHLGRDDHRYGRIRLWGSVGFIVAVVGVGEAIDRFGLSLVPLAVLALFAGLALASLAAPEARTTERSAAADGFLTVLRRPEVIGFLAACFLLQASHGPFYGFFSIYLEDHGYRGAAIGSLWAVGVVAEIGVFLVMHRLIPRFGVRRLLVAALLLAAGRWVVIGAMVHAPLAIAAAQTLHAASFGVYHAAAIHTVNRFFVGRNQGRGQALYSSLTFGAGVAVGSLLAGWGWEALGGATYYAAAGAALLAAACAWHSLRTVK